MTRICYILLCHKNAAAAIAQCKMLTAAGDYVVVHIDRNAPSAFARQITGAFSDSKEVAFASRVRCGWGQWSLVQATLNGLKKAVRFAPDASHFYLISGDCMPIKSAATIREHLAQDPRDIIEIKDFLTSGWIKIGLKKERLIYRHPFNERAYKRLFYGFLAAQKWLGLERAVPEGLQIMIGSQWFCLRRATVEKLLEFIGQRRDVRRFFALTWVPDEIFVQTLVHHLVPRAEIAPHPPTFLLFSDYGMPVNFQNDHFDFLVAQDRFFARKLSGQATGLKARLVELYAAPAAEFPQNGRGTAYHSYVTSRGRAGLRYSRRIWERGGQIGRGQRVIVLTCKKWDVAKRFSQALGNVAPVSAYGYVFSELDAGLPNLGGVETTLAKRNTNRRAFLRLLANTSGKDQIVICLDSANLDALREILTDPADVRLLEITCDFSDEYLTGHGQRMGLNMDNISAGMLGELLGTLRANIRDESEALRGMRPGRFEVIHEDATPAQIVAPLARLLGLDEDRALAIAGQYVAQNVKGKNVQL